jgi:hypothetical protein
VKKLIIILVVLMCLVVLAVGGGLFWLSGYVNSDAFVRKVEQQAGQALGAPVAIGRIGLSMQGLEAREIRIPNAPPRQSEAFLTLERASITIDWMTLFEDEVEVEAINLNQPALALYQGEDGAILLPFKKKEKAVPSTETSSGEGEGGTALNIGRIDLNDGQLIMKDSEGEMLVAIERLQVTTNYRTAPGGASSGQGEIHIPVLTLAGGITLNDLQSPLTIRDNVIEMSQITGNAYGGDLKGAMKVALAESEDDPGSYALDLDLTGASLRELTLEQESPKEGTLALNAGIQGTLEEPKNANGKGTIQIDQLSVPGVESFQALGTVLGLDVLKKGKAEVAKGTFTIHDQLLDFSSLTVDSKGVDIDLAGTLSFEKMLDFKGEAILEAGVSTLFNDLAGDLLDTERQKKRTIPLKISGPVTDPKIDAETSAIAADVGKTLFDRFLGPGSKQNTDSPSDNETETKTPSLLDNLFN